MIKKDLARNIAEATNISIQDANNILEITISEIKRAFHKGERIDIRGFGSFIAYTQKARTARNISTGETVNVPERKVLKFKMSKTFDD